MVSAHMYPYSACAPPPSPLYPTIPRVLSEQATAGMATALRPSIERAQNAGYPFRLTELNSVTCGGLAGVSDAFATSLWVPTPCSSCCAPASTESTSTFAFYAINAAFALTDRGLVARPLLYGLILFTRTLGPDPVMVGLRVHTPPSVDLKAWAVRARGGVLHVLLINKSKHAVTVSVSLPTTGSSSVQHLIAPSGAAHSGVTLDGEQLGRDNRWHGQPATETIARAGGGYELTVPASSAALVTANLRPGALR